MSWSNSSSHSARQPASSRPSSSTVDSRATKRARPDGNATPSSSSRTGGAPSPVERIINLDAPPMLRVGKSTNQPISDRQKALRTLYTQFQKLYAGILKENPALAHESALAQEAETSERAGRNLKAYKLAVHQAAVAVSRRPVPNKIPHSSIGTVRQVLQAQEAEKIAEESKLTPEILSEHCLPVDEMVEWGYPDPKDPEIQSDSPQPPGPSAEGARRICERCSVEFVVTADDPERGCHFHHGRLAPERVDGRRTWIYSCCRNERGSAGCDEGVHVISDKDDDKKLAAVNSFMTTENVVRGITSKLDPVDVVAVDCEMIYTTAGSSLARVSIVDQEGKSLLDECVRQTFPVLDLNTRFSGITQSDLDNAVFDLPGVRAAVCTVVGPNTVMVGHGLENDLRALRLLHNRVIDTAAVFPHDKGRPFRRALRDLVKEKLGYFIQYGTAVAGHSSLEDAKATIELLKWKVRDDKKPIMPVMERREL